MRFTQAPLRHRTTQKNVTGLIASRSSSLNSAKSSRVNNKHQTMKRKLLAVVAAGAIALGGFVVVYAQPGPGGAGCAHGHAFGLGHLTEKLNLTSDQQTKVKPILDQAKTQIVAIHQAAMQKHRTYQDRPLLKIC